MTGPNSTNSTGNREIPTYAVLLRQFRKQLDMDRPMFASKLNVGQSSISKAENGIRAPGVFIALSEVFPDEAVHVLAAYEAKESFTDSEDEPEPELLIPSELIRGLAEAKVTRFFASREFYKKFRYGRATISQYVSGAQASLDMVSITLATGHEIEGIMDTFEEMLERRSAPIIRISLLDPDKFYLMESIAPVIRTTPETLQGRIRDTASAIERLRSERLSRVKRQRLELWHHPILPNASAIIIDGDLPRGTVQLETKGYRTGMDKSFGFEVGYGSDFFETLRESYRDLITDGRRVL